MREHTNVLVFLFVISCMIAYVMLSSQTQKEYFDTGDDIDLSGVSVSNVSGEELGELPVQVDSPQGVSRDLTMRPCRVYHTPEVDFCDQGKFNTPISWYRNQLARERDTTKRQEYERIIAAYGKIPYGQCRTDFDGWYEEMYNPRTPPGAEKQIMAIKNSSAQTNGSPVDWATCYAPVESDAEAIEAAAPFENATTIVNESRKLNRAVDSPFNDDSKYAMISFKTLNLSSGGINVDNNRADNLKDDICDIPLTSPPEDLPRSFLRLVLQNGTRNISGLSSMQFNSTGTYANTFTTYDASTHLAILKNMFEAKPAANNIVYLASKPVSATLTKVQFVDNCYRVKVLARQQISLSFNVPQNRYIVYRPSSALTRGTFEQLSARLNEYTTIQNTKQAAHDTATTEARNAVPSYKNGLIKTVYLHPPGAWPTGYARNPQHMDEYFSKLTPTGDSVVIYTKPKFHCSESRNERIDTRTQPNRGAPMYEDTCYIPGNPTPNKNYAILYEGYIKTQEPGDYMFWINSDDMSDITVYDTAEGTVVATHYGVHGFDAKGKPLFMLSLDANKYYKIKIRLVQGAGDSGLVVYWARPSVMDASISTCTAPQYKPHGARFPRGYECFEEIPASAFYYNETEQNAGAVATRVSSALRELKIAKKNVTLIKQALSEHITGFAKQISTYMQSMVGKDINTFMPAVAQYHSSHLSIRTQLDAQKNPIKDSSGNNLQFELMFLSVPEAAADIEAQLNLDFNVSDLAYGPTAVPYNIWDGEIEISNNYKVINDSPYIDYNGPVSYTVSMFIKFDQLSRDWRSLLFHGNNDNWGNENLVDRVPGVWIYPNASYIHFRHRSRPVTRNRGADVNNGCDLTAQRPPLRQWFHFAATVDENRMSQYIRIFYNGVQVNSSADGARTWSNPALPPEWNKNVKPKYFFLNHHKYFDGNYSRSDAARAGSVKVRNVQWYNSALENDEIRAIYDEFK